MEEKKGGRPTKFKPEYVNIIKAMCELGATVTELADALGVADSTVYLWATKYPELQDAMKLGRDAADERVVNALYHRALGYSHPEDDIRVVNGQIEITPTVKHYPPDATSMIFWLKNRRPTEWRQQPEADDGESATPQSIEIVIKDASQS